MSMRLRSLIITIGALVGIGAAMSYAMAGVGDSFFTHIHTDKAMANVTVTPGRDGPVDISVQLETTDEQPLAALAVSIKLTNPNPGSISIETIAEHGSDDQWRARVSVPSNGRWDMGLNIKLSETDHVSIAAPILIE